MDSLKSEKNGLARNIKERLVSKTFPLVKLEPKSEIGVQEFSLFVSGEFARVYSPGEQRAETKPEDWRPAAV